MYSELLLVYYFNKGSNIEWSRWIVVMMWAIVILSCLILLDRSDFVNVLLFNSAFYWNYDMGCFY